MLHPPAYADGLDSLRSAGMGDNVVGGAGSNAALFHNPAALSAVPLYSLELGYNKPLGEGGNHLGISIADAKTNAAIAGGAAYTFSFQREPINGKKKLVSMRHEVRLGAALPIVQDVLILGVTGQYINQKNMSGYGSSSVGRKGHAFSVDLGVMAMIGKQFFLGVSAMNLAQKEGLTDPREIRAGFAGIIGPLRLMGEYGAEIDGARTRHHVGPGAEFMIKSIIALRAGYRYATANQLLSNAPQYADAEHLLSFGLGYRGRSFGVDFAYRQQLQKAPQRLFGVSLVLLM